MTAPHDTNPMFPPKGKSNVYVEHYREEFLSPERANLKIRLRFEQKYLLEINEAIIVAENKIKTLDYRYHFQDQHNRLIFRYV